MLIINDNNAEIIKNGCVATVGFFNGVHAGHRFLIEELKSIGRRHDLPTLIITFAVHPRRVLNADYHPQLLTTLDEKLDLLSASGVNACVVLNFSVDMAKLSAYDFLQQILQAKYNVRTLLVGHDHRFGHNRAEGYSDYVNYGNMLGMQLIEAQRFHLDNEQPASSSYARKSLLKGDVHLSKLILGYNYSFRGTVVSGFKVGRKIGFPTANIQPEDSFKLIPSSGVYNVWVKFESNLYRGMMNIGFRPTIQNGSERSIEVHIFNFDREIYNSSIEIIFLRKIREEKKFANVTELIEQLNKDKFEIIENSNLT